MATPKKVAAKKTTAAKAPGRKAAAKQAAKKDAGPKSADPSVSSGSASDAVDEQLARYRSMRDFHVTAEPSGGETAATSAKVDALPFCIQKHAASHLHYDFRLGWNGVLKSWACAKGPSYNVHDKRLAVQVEDHPMEYGGFEGIIPAGQYGGGTVMLWDQGTWEPQPGHTDVDAALRDGQLKFVMHGTKIKGKWALIRMGGKAAQEKKPNWLLIKEHDEFERPDGAAAVTDAESKSVVTGRSLEEIASNEDHVWNSKETAQGNAWYRKEPEKKGAEKKLTADSAPAVERAGAAASKQSWTKELKGLPDELQPSFLKPQLAGEATSPPEGDAWLHELKLDGYRIQARKEGRKVQMLTRSGLDWTYRIPAVAEVVGRLSAANVTLDGEVVVLGEDGTTNFAELQASFQDGARNPLTYFCFDLLHLEGKNVRGLPLVRRKELLAEVLASGDGDTIRVSEHITSGGEAIFRKACELHAEGIVSKKAQGRSIEGRSSDWLKCKCLHEQEFVVGAYTLPSDGSHGIGSLLLGYYKDGKLVYAGRTGTGFTQKVRRSLREALEELETDVVPFHRPPAEAKRGAVWVQPRLVAQVRFATWTAEDLVRQAAFLGLREDKAAEEVRREEATAPPRPKGSKPAKFAGESPPARQAQPASQELSVAAKMMSSEASRSRKSAPSLPAAASETPTVAAPSRQTEPEHAPVRLTHPGKVLDTESGVTKQMLADFYWAVAERMLPHIADRPLSLVRCPEGSDKPCFYQKHVNHMLPKGIGAVDVPDKKTGVVEPYITLRTPEALAGLAQMGVLEVHPWGSCNGDLEHADRLIFDLDPDEALGWEQVTAAAGEVRQRLREIGLESFLKTTGGKGLHIVTPVTTMMEWPGVKEWARLFVTAMERANPALYLTKMTKAARVGKIYLDYLRNERGATAVAPYSPRARSGMGVSLPIAWSELKSTRRPNFRVANFAEWRQRLETDPWTGMSSIRQKISPVS